MPVDQAPSPAAARKSDGTKLVRYQDFIDAKIESTRRLVKVVDWATALVSLAIGLLLFLLVVTLLEHWVVPGGLSTAARWVLFAGMTAYVSYFAYRRLWPLCVRAINPVYAAHTIEHGSPALKNSLINLLMFRQRRTDISDAVYRTLEEEAAHGLTRVHVDSSVDQSQLIRLGYFLIGIVAVAAMYKVFSPKDPLVAAERVLMPWANVVPASRVSIKEIKPGVTTISRGEYVDVSAEIRGLKDEENVVLRCTSEEGQSVGRAIPMKGSAGGLQFTCRLEDEADGGESVGVTRNLVYWLEAGDARSLNYAITVVPAASILVERVDYDYPAYTGYVDRSVEGIGDIRAIEGTKVTVHARANGPIREANVDYDADGRRDLTMSAAEAKAHATFELALREDRQTPWHASYVLRFTNDEGRENHGPVKHAIQVDRDLAPEIEIRLPQEKSRDARADESVAIEITASDPDFSLAAVRLRGEVGKRPVLNEPLLAGEQRGRFAGRYVFTPNAHELKAGDVLEYWIEADDNRTPKPNMTVSEHRVLRIVASNPAQQPPPGQIAQNEKPQQPQPGEQENQQPQNGKKGGEQQGGKQGRNSGKPKEGQEGGQAQQGEGGEGQQSKGQGKEQGEGKGSQQGESGGQSQPGKQGGEGQQADGNQNQDSTAKNDGTGQKGASGQNGKQSPPGESPPDQQDPTKSNGEQKGANGESSKGGPQPDGSQPDTKSGQKSQGGGQSKEQRQEKQGDEQTPVSSEGDNDAEAFNRIQKHMQEKGELKKDGSGAGEKSAGEKSNDPNQPFSRDAERSAEEQKQGKGDKETGRQGDKEGGKAKQGDDPKSQGEGKSKSPDGKAGEQSKDGTQQPKPEGTPSNDRGEGTGAETRGDDTSKKPEPDQGQQQQEKSPGGEQTNSKGAAGNGNEQKSQGAPNSKPEMKPTEKPEQAPSKGEKTNQQEPPAGANSKKESDSHGDQGGDKAGGGEEGGGQKAPREGTGSAGQNQSADNGAGQSGEKGKGENSSEGGQDAKSKEKTGASDGKTPGKGSQQKDGTGDKSGGKQGAGDKGASAGGQQQPFSRDAERSAEEQKQKDKETGRQGDKETKQPGDKDASKQGEKNAGKQGDAESKNGKQENNENQSADNTNAGGASGGGGQPGGAVNPSPSSTGEAPAGEAANLEYARKQTDMVLDKLADQMSRKKVDGELLKELGWSEAELKRFLDRWQQRKEAAKQNDEKGEAAKRELDDALRSLGLHRGELQQNTATKDNMRDLKEGYRGPVPAEYKERLRAYNQGVSRAHRDGE